MKLVVDASVVVSALIDKDLTGMWAREQLKGDPVAAPQLILVESTNSLRRAEQVGNISGGLSALVYDDLLNLSFELYPFRPFAQRVWELRHTVTAYDAWYVALAEQLERPLATLDDRLTRAPGPTCRFVTPTSH